MLRSPHRLSWSAVIAVLLLVTFSSHAQDAPVVDSAVTEVTLYRNQAQVVRTFEVPAGEGPVELVVSGLPDQIVGNSLFAEGGEQVDVRAVRLRQRVVGEEPRDDIRALDEQILVKTEEVEVNTAMQGLAQSQLAYLTKLEGFTATRATDNLAEGALDAAQLREASQYIFEQRGATTRELLELRSAARMLQRELQTLQQQRSQLAGRTQTVVREAVLFLDRREAGAATVKLTYQVGNCGWSPSYNVRGDLEDASVRVEYNALIRQMTGEDWTGVTLTLSTATPMISASGPAMASFPVMLTPAAPGRPGSGVAGPGGFSPGEQADLNRQYADLQSQRQGAALSNSAAVNLRDNLAASWEGNEFAARAQVLELSAGLAAIEGYQQQQTSSSSVLGLSINYTLEGPVTLQSRSDQQMTRILQAEMAGEFYHVASPVLTEFVYREAEINNSSGKDLLDGPVNVYLDGRFVGRTEMVSVTRGQKFVVGFGADPQLHAKRELVSRDEDAQGGNTLLGFEYRLAIENYSDQPADVRLMDRIPTFRDGDDVKITIGEVSEALSDDATYLRLMRPEGILRWDTAVPANASGEDAHVVSYAFNLAFDRNFVLSTGDMDKLRMEFEEQERNRRGR